VISSLALAIGGMRITDLLSMRGFIARRITRGVGVDDGWEWDCPFSIEGLEGSRRFAIATMCHRQIIYKVGLIFIT
jgi:hypothetical protein